MTTEVSCARERVPAIDPDRTTGRTAGRTVRVASVPAGHVYVRHLQPADAAATAVVRLPDPDPDDPARPAGARWWPPVMLSEGWVDAHADRFDLMHVHFGFDALEPADLRAVVGALRRHGKPLVYTVHDLRNPHHEDPAAHDAHLDVLVPAADALVTLTDGAADAVERRWGRRPVVVPHPHVVDLVTMAAYAGRPRARDGFRVGVHVKSLRPSMDPLPVLRVVRRTLAGMPGAVLQVNGHRDVLLPDGTRYDAGLVEQLTAWSADGRVEVRVHDFLPDDQLWAYLASLDASVLPYRFGTHSGWLEACRDLGTTVLAPDCGFYAEQGPVVGYHHDEAGLDEDSLVRALRTAYDAPRAEPVPVGVRVAQRAEVARAHDELYRRLLR